MINNNVLFQTSPVAAVVQGLYDGVMTIREVLEHGNFGIGTVEALDGEMIIIGGEAYVVKYDGSIEKVSGEKKIPYASVTFFSPDKEEALKYVDNKMMLKLVEEAMKSKNLFYAISIKGKFSYMKTRVVQKQQKPYSKLVNVTDEQAIFEVENVEGTIIGFYSPKLYEGISASGLHLHFLSSNISMGGHVLDYVVESGIIQISAITDLLQHFPVNNINYLTANFDEECLIEDLKKSER